VGEGGLLWVVDDRPSRRFPIYTRGNAGEVYPNVITPLCGSIVKEPIARGQERVFREMGMLTAADLHEGDRAVLTGCFGGYLYANLSVGRLLGVRSPGMKPEDADAQLFGTSDAPPYRRQPGDRDLRATARLTRFMGRVLRGPDFGWLQAERTEVAGWHASRPEPATAGNDELLETVDEGAAQLTALMRSLLLASSYGGVGAAILERLVSKAEPEASANISVGVGGVESAEPASELWRLSRLGADTDDFRDGFAAFLNRFGSRGPDEWELASHTWGTDPEIALAAVERIRNADREDPVAEHAHLAERRHQALGTVERSVPRPVRPMFRRAAQLTADGAAGREFAKGTIVLALYAMRLALFELVRRGQEAGGPAERSDCWLVTRDELPSFLERPAAYTEAIDERRERRDLLQGGVPPFVFEGAIPDPATWQRRDDLPDVKPMGRDARLEGIAVSPGTAVGRVRVIRDPSDPSALEPGDVLVAPITDPAWTPLFLVANAVVCEVGANLSHAAIVARELGIPAVVSVDHATRRLPEGALVEVDGTRGTVRVLELP
jgi:pyruvate,water dikinase